MAVLKYKNKKGTYTALTVDNEKSDVWVGTTPPPSDDYVLWINPNESSIPIDTADEVDIDSIW